MIEHNTFEEFYNEFKDWSKKDILKRVYNLINETNKWTDVYLDTMNNQQKEIERLNNIINELEKDNKTLIEALESNDTNMTSNQQEIFDKYYLKDKNNGN